MVPIQKCVIHVLSIITVLLFHGHYSVVKLENPVPPFSYSYTKHRSNLGYIIELMHSAIPQKPEVVLPNSC